MRSLFTIHAGEYLVGSYIEDRFKNIKVWIPSKDTGVDLLLTDKSMQKTIAVQVKYSKDFLPTHMGDIYQKGLKSCGWWTLNKEKISNSNANYWIFVMHNFKQKNIQYIIIPPDELLDKLILIHGEKKDIKSYFWVTEKKKCWESRGLKKSDQILLANHSYKNNVRDFSTYLNNWDKILKKLK